MLVKMMIDQQFCYLPVLLPLLALCDRLHFRLCLLKLNIASNEPLLQCTEDAEAHSVMSTPKLWPLLLYLIKDYALCFCFALLDRITSEESLEYLQWVCALCIKSVSGTFCQPLVLTSFFDSALGLSHVLSCS